MRLSVTFANSENCAPEGGASVGALRSVDRTAVPGRLTRPKLMVVLLTSVLNGATPILAQETIDTRIGKLTFESGYPSKETVQKLYDEMDFQRATQAYIWGIPAVGLAQWRLAHRDVFKAKNGEMLSYLDFTEKLGILTPKDRKSTRLNSSHLGI